MVEMLMRRVFYCRWQDQLGGGGALLQWLLIISTSFYGALFYYYLTLYINWLYDIDTLQFFICKSVRFFWFEIYGNKLSMPSLYTKYLRKQCNSKSQNVLMICNVIDIILCCTTIYF